jgi:tRNA nucleotidyltransferase/poly(A) polymerase
LDEAIHQNALYGEVTMLATGGWVRDKLLNKKRSKINLVFHTDRKDVSSNSLATLFKNYEK